MLEATSRRRPAFEYRLALDGRHLQLSATVLNQLQAFRSANYVVCFNFVYQFEAKCRLAFPSQRLFCITSTSEASFGKLLMFRAGSSI